MYEKFCGKKIPKCTLGTQYLKHPNESFYRKCFDDEGALLKELEVSKGLKINGNNSIAHNFSKYSIIAPYCIDTNQRNIAPSQMGDNQKYIAAL